MPKHSILASFAHPDDETSVGPLLAKYAREGHDVYLVSITSGQRGTAHNQFEPGEELAAVREDELRCAARQLGIHEPLLLRFQDQGISAAPVTLEIAQRLREVINRTKPDVVITFGPGGVTGHVDHIAAGEVTTRVFERQGLLEHRPKKLYYVAFPESQFAQAPDQLKARAGIHLVNDCFITTEVDCSAFLDPAVAALRCHKTQFTPDRVEMLRELHKRAFGGHVFLRLALACPPLPRRRETCVLEGLDGTG